MRTFHKDGSRPESGQIFLFGSNLSGIHGAGAAKAAHRDYGAAWGVAEGLTGRSYALPTVQRNIAGPLPLSDIKESVGRFLEFANAHPEFSFFVTRVGCVLAGHNDSDIAPMFSSAPENCSLPDTWSAYIGETA